MPFFEEYPGLCALLQKLQAWQKTACYGKGVQGLDDQDQSMICGCLRAVLIKIQPFDRFRCIYMQEKISCKT